MKKLFVLFAAAMLTALKREATTVSSNLWLLNSAYVSVRT